MSLVPKVLEDAVDRFAELPGVGRKTAFRYVLHLLKQDDDKLRLFGRSLDNLITDANQCKTCFNVADTDHCSICASLSRDHSLICVVEDIRDVILFESTEQFIGTYHVLGGVISPMDGVGPSDLNIEALVERVESGQVKEVVMALNTTMEGDTTNFYLYRILKDKEVKLTTLARGVSSGGGLEYTDEVTLGRSLTQRVQYESTLSSL
jgi:recombination protein RecR